MLTSKEHFICHRLLAKIMLDATNKRCMESAFWLMLNSGQNTYTSTTYAIARRNKSNAMEMMWTSQKYKDDMLMKKQWFYNDPAQKEANRQKALKEMENPETKAKFVKAGLEAAKVIRDKDIKSWVSSSIGSENGRAKAEVAHQSEGHRKACSERELSKSKEKRSAFAKQGQVALMEKLGGEDAYKKYLSERIKGRKRYINIETGQIKMLREPIDGFILV